MHPDGPEAQVVRNYLDWVVDLPWDRCSPDQLDLDLARAVLDKDHAHLSIVKDRILHEFLGVRKLREDSRGPILCFAGPPGVGKTSLGRSIARAMGREFVRVSLGGVRDEAEIRGHRRTYVGAMPGRIIQGLKTAGTANPVMMLDELDKLGGDFRGDPSAALLEVLDPEQNKDFSDHFLNTPFDLSKVLFIATANMLEAIPAPLRDRMEVIRLSGYTPEEKSEITTHFLIPRQIEEHGMEEEQVLVHEERDHEPLLGLHLRGRRPEPRAPGRGDLPQGRAEARRGRRVEGHDQYEESRQAAWAAAYKSDHASEESEVGLVNGLAWTEAGGEVLSLEANLSRGRGLLLTGQLGDVMKESGQTALSYVRFRSSARSAWTSVSSADSRSTSTCRPGHCPRMVPPPASRSRRRSRPSRRCGSPGRRRHDGGGHAPRPGPARRWRSERRRCRAAQRHHHDRDPGEQRRRPAEIPKELKKRLDFVPVKHMREVLDQVLVEPLDWRPRKRVSLATSPRPDAGVGLPAQAAAPDVSGRRD